MDLVAALTAFVVAVFLISASPGPAMALILRRAALRGFRGAVPTVLGLAFYPQFVPAVSGTVLVGMGLRVAATASEKKMASWLHNAVSGARKTALWSHNAGDHCVRV